MRVSFQQIISLCSVIIISCGRPLFRFDAYTPPPEPDYALEPSWAALPWKKDSADALPRGFAFSDDQQHAPVDVFFIHPTTHFSALSWNADICSKRINRLTEQTTIRHQASVFNGSGKIYAPRYRQATVYSFMDKRGSGQKALDLAYGDVRNAFLYFLKNYNKSRPFIIGSHSQGTYHARRIIQEIVEKDSTLMSRLIAAYLIGGPIIEGDFKKLPPCESPDQTGCYVQWNTLAWGLNPVKLGKLVDGSPLGSLRAKIPTCTNPLSWKKDTVTVHLTGDTGSVSFFFNRIATGLTSCKCSGNGYLWVKPIRLKGYSPMASYHLLDYNLFYRIMRNNVQKRINAYYKNSHFATND